MQIRLRGNKVAVEKNKKAGKAQETSFIVMPESEEYLGTVRYVGDAASSDLKVGQKVYFSTSHQNVRIAGSDLCIMEDTSVLAVVDDEIEKNKQA